MHVGRKTVCAALFVVLMGICPAARAEGPSMVPPSLRTSTEVNTTDSIWTRPTLTGDWGGLRTQLNEQGVSFGVEVTQFGSGMTSGEGSKSWQLGGKVDLYSTVSGAKVGLWDGLFINVRGEQNYGRDLNGFGKTLVPNNAALAFPGTREGDLGLDITQKFSDVVALKIGKLNMLDAAKATPIKGGGGVDTFMNMALAAPITGLMPPKIFGAILSVNTKPVSYALAVYDPIDVTQRTGMENPFSEGVSFRGSATLAAKPFGLQGSYGVKAMYSTMNGLDLRSIPDLLFPSETGTVVPTRSNPYFFAVSIQQYLYQDANDPKRGWGFFGEFGFSDGNPTKQQWMGYFGLGGASPLPMRAADRWGVAVFRNSLSDYLVRGMAPLLRLRDEQGMESYYNVAVTPWLHVSADIQWVRPFLVDAPNALFTSLRTNIKF